MAPKRPPATAGVGASASDWDCECDCDVQWLLGFLRLTLVNARPSCPRPVSVTSHRTRRRQHLAYLSANPCPHFLLVLPPLSSRGITIYQRRLDPVQTLAQGLAVGVPI
jgi:hypothetical protein